MWLLLLILLLQINLPDDVPPVAYTNWDTSFEHFTVHDLTTGETEQVDQPEGYAGFYTGSIFRTDNEPIDYEITSPAGDVYIMRDEITEEGNILYSLLAADEVLITGLDRSGLAWSNDGAYGYFIAEHILYQLDTQTNTFAPLTDVPTGWLMRCSREQGCLLLMKDETEQQLVHFDVNTAILTPLLPMPNDVNVSASWVDENKLAVVYDQHYFVLLDAGEIILEAEFDSIYTWSASAEWAIFMTVSTQEPLGITMQSINFSSGIQFTYSTEFGPNYNIQHGLTWLPDGRVAFTGTTPDAPNGGIFIVKLEGLSIYQTVAFPEALTIYDQAWSPDGNWLLYTYEKQLYLVPWDGSEAPQLIETQAPVDCVAWEEEYAPGTLICDKNWGMGG